jgi:hypothetical protein
MSPEQHDGKTGDALSDQFSFAVSLYESLHGRRPFAGRSASEIASATRSGSLAPGGDGVPRAVDRVLSTALHPDPGRRFASMEELLGALQHAVDRRPVAAWLAGAAVLIVAGAVGARLSLHRAPPPIEHAAPAVQAAATPTPAPIKIAPRPPAAPTASAPDGEQTGLAAAPSRAPSDGTSGPPRHRRQLAQAAPQPAQTPPQPPPQPGQTPQFVPPAEVIQVQIVARAEQHMYKREGAACLAALDKVVGDWVEILVPRAQEARANCELLVGHCEKGKKLLEAAHVNDRRYGGTVGEGLLSMQVAEMCPVGSFPTVEKRVMAASIQAQYASGKTTSQSVWCGTLERTLLADTKSALVQDCFAEFIYKPTERCGLLIANLREAYRYLGDCFFRDKSCREGARLDVMHTQLEVLTVAPDDPRVERWCRPSRAIEMFNACGAAGEEAQRQCMKRVEAARQSGVPKLLPEILPR